MNNIEIEAKINEFDRMFPQFVELEEYTASGRTVIHASLWLEELLVNLTKNHEKEKEAAVIAERDRILANILKWSETATVVETTSKGGAARATKKLREHLYGSYHFLYQAVRHNVGLSKTDVTK